MLICTCVNIPLCRGEDEDEIAQVLDDRTALHRAIYKGDVKTVKELDEIARVLADHTALNRAIYKGDVKAVKELIEGHVKAAKQLIVDRLIVDVDRLIVDSGTQLLKEFKEDISITTETLLSTIIAVEAKTDAVNEKVKMLSSDSNDSQSIASAYVNGVDEYGITPLHFAAEYGRNDETMVTLLLDSGADVKAESDNGDTPLHKAAKSTFADRTKIIAVLLARGADINATNEDGNAPLHLSLGGHGPLSLKTLLAHGAAINVKNKDGNTPLHCVTYNGEPEKLNILLDHGANPHMTNVDGQTPLMLARNNFNHWDNRSFKHSDNHPIVTILARATQPTRTQL